jgi:hypothetical protein
MMFASRAELWAFVAIACAVAIIVALLLAGCQMPLRSAEYLFQRLVRIEADNARQLKELDHVDPALAALNPRNPRLVLPHPSGDVGLA